MSIRAARESDIAAMLAIYGPYVEHTTYSFEYTVPAYDEFLTRFREHVARFPWLVWEEEGRVLGYCYAGAPWSRAAYSWCAEASVYLAQEARGRGIGRALYERLEEILARQGYRLVYAIITEENAGSVAFHRRMGYRDRAVFPGCGYKHGRWLGVVWLEKKLNGAGHPEEFPGNWMECM